MKEGTVADVVDAQISSQGVSCITVSDGCVFTFTARVLEQLLAQAQDSGRVVVFVKRAVAS